ncbi:MAG: hypothetical protein M3N32_11350, partial [Actinomycetota bacterium]|nr:hypothetical protein [Actinomycetota bacterium]
MESGDEQLAGTDLFNYSWLSGYTQCSRLALSRGAVRNPGQASLRTLADATRLMCLDVKAQDEHEEQAVRIDGRPGIAR